MSLLVNGNGTVPNASKATTLRAQLERIGGCAGLEICMFECDEREWVDPDVSGEACGVWAPRSLVLGCVHGQPKEMDPHGRGGVCDPRSWGSHWIREIRRCFLGSRIWGLG